MSSERPEPIDEPRDRAAGMPGEPSEEELRAAYEAELSRLTSADLIAQAVVSLLNVAARRLGPIGDQTDAGTAGQAAGEPRSGGAPAGSERDLDQVRDAIDAVRALLEILERRVPEGLRPLREALSQLQMAYAREVQAGGAGGGGGAAGGGGDATGGQGSPGEGPAGGQGPGTGAQEAPQGERRPGEPGPAQKSGRLWVPGS